MTRDVAKFPGAHLASVDPKENNKTAEASLKLVGFRIRRDDQGQLWAAPRDTADVSAAQKIAKEMSAPLSLSEASRVMQTLMLLTVPKPGDEARVKARTREMVVAIMDYPADIAADFCTKWPRHTKWPPELADIHNGCQALQRASGRQELIDAVLKPKITRKRWEEIAAKFCKDTIWDMNVPGPATPMRCPMPGDLLRKCHEAYVARINRQHAAHAAAASEGMFVPKAKDFEFKEPRPDTREKAQPKIEKMKREITGDAS